MANGAGATLAHLTGVREPRVRSSMHERSFGYLISFRPNDDEVMDERMTKLRMMEKKSNDLGPGRGHGILGMPERPFRGVRRV